MNRDRFKKNIGFRVQLQPPAIWLNELGFERPALGDDWIVERVTDDVVQLSAIGSGHCAILGHDHIKDFKSDPSRSQTTGLQYGFLTLTVQIYIKGNRVLWKPTLRPGEPLPPAVPKATEMIVDFAYPADCGLQAELEEAGYELQWCLVSRLARAININGWEVVRVQGNDGTICSF